jgi:hypothetical protein
MLPVRRSVDEEPNPTFRRIEPVPGETNLQWLERAHGSERLGERDDVLILGGAGLADFRVRVAQSHARDDLTPSYWSLVGVVDARNRLLTAPLWPLARPEQVPISNGIRSLPLSDFDDPQLWPNIAIVRFAGTHESPVECIRRLRGQRSLVDLPALVLSWLGFVWGAGSVSNPLVSESGVPSAVLVETAFGIAEVELTPGLAAASSCPEAIYQAAKWWHTYYKLGAGEVADAETHQPHGWYTVRQATATYLEPELPDQGRSTRERGARRR